MEPESFLVPNTLSLACVAARLCDIEGTGQMAELVCDSDLQAEDVLALGSGSNVVLPARLNKTWVRITDVSIQRVGETDEETVIRVGAGKNWHELVLESLEQRLFGLENLALIPGLVGASPIQNIGAYGRELSEFVVAVTGFDLAQRKEVQLSAAACEFAYRDSIFKQQLRDRFVVTSVDLRLSRSENPHLSYPSLRARFDGATAKPTAQEICDTVIAVRRERLPDPDVTPNAGSFFKNPIISEQQATTLSAVYADLPVYRQADGRVKSSAAWLIERAGLRGASVGGAAVSNQHSLVLVNRSGATQADVLALAQHIRSQVRGSFGVELEIEPRVYHGE